MNVANLKISRFLEELGSEKPSPGGGAAAATIAATGIALAEMVTRINLKKKRSFGEKRLRMTEDTQAKVRAKELSKLRTTLLKLATLDAAAFQKISSAYKKGKDSAAYQKALATGARVPFEICGFCMKGLRLASFEKTRTSKWLYSDLKESAIVLEAAFRSARLNVEINLRDMTDAKLKNNLEQSLQNLEEQIHGYQASLTA